jgi:Tol biopolymer transport system component
MPVPTTQNKHLSSDAPFVMDRSLIPVLLTGLLLGGMLGCDLLGLLGEEPLGRVVFTKRDLTETGPDRFVYTMNTDGSDRTRLTFPDDSVSCGPNRERTCGVGTAYRARWGPEGERIAFVSSAGPEHWSIVVMNADGTNKRTIAAVFDKPRWSLDGERLLVRKREIHGIITGTYVVEADGSEITCIVCTDREPVTFQGDTLSASTVQWGPTSDLLYLFSYPDEAERPDQFESLYLFRISTREVVRKVASLDLREGLSIGPNGTISPDGERILFADRGNVYQSSPPGAAAEQLTTGPTCEYGACGDFDVNWGDDGRHFVYARFEAEDKENGKSPRHVRLGDVRDDGDGRRVSPVSGRYPDLFIPGE